MTTPDIPTEALEAAARALYDIRANLVTGARPWHAIQDGSRRVYLDHARIVLFAAAPHLIAEGRRQAAEAIRAEGPRVTEVKFWFVHGEERYESGAEWAARIAEGADHGPSPAERFAAAEARAEVRTRRSNVLGAEWAAQIEAAEGVDHG